MTRPILPLFIALAIFLAVPAAMAQDKAFAVADTGQQACYDESRQIPCPGPGRNFHGQDAQYRGNEPRYRDNGDATVSDLTTGLMWVKARGDKMYWDQAGAGAASCRVGGYDDWRAPTIKELYSLIDFRGSAQRSASSSTPFIDTRFFGFKFGDTRAGERFIDCQDWSATKYVSTTMNNAATAFGVNFADGRIKGYPLGEGHRNPRDKRYMRYVRGNPAYGRNDFAANGDGTVADRATGLVWQRADSGQGLDWKGALAYCEGLSLAGRDDWRLPNAKELQSIVDYTRSPTTTGSAAIDPVFQVTEKESYFWSSTTHHDGPDSGSHGVYVAFGRAMGFFAPPGSGSQKRFIDVHGAGAQRSDPKTGDPSDYPQGFGPQGDDRRILNAARCVRGGAADPMPPGASLSERAPWAGAGVGMDSGPGTGLDSERGPRLRLGQDHSSGQEMGPGMGQGQGPGQGMGQGQGMAGPPPQALEACNGKSQGEACSFQAPHGAVSGTCLSTPGGLACAPRFGPGGGPGRPPGGSMRGPGMQ